MYCRRGGKRTHKKIWKPHYFVLFFLVILFFSFFFFFFFFFSFLFFSFLFFSFLFFSFLFFSFLLPFYLFFYHVLFDSLLFCSILFLCALLLCSREKKNKNFPKKKQFWCFVCVALFSLLSLISPNNTFLCVTTDLYTVIPPTKEYSEREREKRRKGGRRGKKGTRPNKKHLDVEYAIEHKTDFHKSMR